MSFQPSLDLPIAFSEDAYAFGNRSDGGTHGVVLTKPHIVELILDLAGYTADRDLGSLRALEPSCGHGAFLVSLVRRLIESARRNDRDIATLSDALVAFDVDSRHVEIARTAVVAELVSQSVEPPTAAALAESWVYHGDFLLSLDSGSFDVVVGNPPYIRIEQLQPELQAEYRRRYATLYDRADIYVAFIERSLSLLSPDGVLSFICADRWTLNRYGAPLREFITSSFDVIAYIDLHSASPFESEVIAYPSIFVIGRRKAGRAASVFTLGDASPEACADVVSSRLARPMETPSPYAARYESWFKGDEPWILSTPEQLAALRDLEARFPLIEEGGRASVRIGVATGNDSVYIVPRDADIEPDRLLPLVMREDIDGGSIRDAGRCVINTFDANGPVELDRYPRLQRYLDRHRDAVQRRHVARKNNRGWFRTIDRVYPQLVLKPKLLIPDIAGSNEVVLERGRFYPHHNLYFIVSDDWDLEVLGGLLSSTVALFFVWSYAVKMRGGYLRFQAQYLRRIRVPTREAIPSALAQQIGLAFRARDFDALDALSREAYGIKTLPTFEFEDTRRKRSGGLGGR